MTRFVACLAAAVAASTVLLAQAQYVPERVFAGARKQFTDFESMLADIARADVVFLGEEHNDPNTHRLELAVLEGLARRRGEVVLSLEMFERDIQEPLAHFLMGHVDEAAFLSEARPWPGYASDYKPLVDFAIAKEWPVIAANVPRALAAEVSQSGLDVLKTKPDAEKAWFAREIKCPAGDAYFKRFEDAMNGHAEPAADAAKRPAARPGATQPDFYYQAQCLKDETMGESIAQAYVAGTIGGKRPLVVSVNGAFHSNYGQGVVERTRRRLPDKRLVVVTFQGVEDLDALAPDADARKRADYLVYTIGRAPTAPADAVPSAGSSSSAP